MAFRILELQGVSRSLEFDETDLPALREFLHSQFKEVDIQENVLHADLFVAGTRLVFYHEWDPCLMSHDEQGSSLLDFIYTCLSASEP